MPVASDVGLPGRLEAVAGIFTNRFEHPVALPGVAQKALLDQRLECIDVGATDRFGDLKRAPADEYRETPEDLLFVGREQVIAPLDRRSEGSLAGIGVATALEQIKTLRKPRKNLGWGECPRTGRRELDCEREGVQAGAEFGDFDTRLELRAVAEERYSLRLVKRKDRVLDLTLHTKELAARNEQNQVGTGEQHARELGRRFNHLLEVVEHQEKLAFADVLAKTILCTDGLGDRLSDQRRVAERGERDPTDAVAEAIHGSGGGF